MAWFSDVEKKSILTCFWPISSWRSKSKPLDEQVGIAEKNFFLQENETTLNLEISDPLSHRKSFF